jgi:hypothetical protein
VQPDPACISVSVALSVGCAISGCSAPPARNADVIRPVKTMVVAAGDDARERFGVLTSLVRSERRFIES